MIGLAQRARQSAAAAGMWPVSPPRASACPPFASERSTVGFHARTRGVACFKPCTFSPNVPPPNTAGSTTSWTRALGRARGIQNSPPLIRRCSLPAFLQEASISRTTARSRRFPMPSTAEHTPTGERRTVNCSGLFCFIGADPATEWLDGAVELDAKGFIPTRWDHYCELMILYMLAIASPTHPIPAESWHAWKRPPITYDSYHYIFGDLPLFVHQYAQAWIDFRGRREQKPPYIDWFENSVTATLAQRAHCIRLHSKFPGYSEDIWGITSSDSVKGYVAWGGPPDDPRVDGTVVPCAPAGSLMFTPRESLAALRKMKQLYGDRIYGRYGFGDAFNPSTGWVDPDVIGIDVGITLISAENLSTGNVWTWFMRNGCIRAAMDRIGLTSSSGVAPNHVLPGGTLKP